MWVASVPAGIGITGVTFHSSVTVLRGKGSLYKASEWNLSHTVGWDYGKVSLRGGEGGYNANSFLITGEKYGKYGILQVWAISNKMNLNRGQTETST